MKYLTIYLLYHAWVDVRISLIGSICCLILFLLDGSDAFPEISSLVGSNIITISENVSNPSIGFTEDSIQATVIDGNILY